MKRLLLGTTFALLLAAPPAAEAKRVNLVLKFGQDVLVAQNDTVSVRAQCLANQPGGDLLRVYAATTASQATMRGLASFSGSGSYLTPATAAQDAVLTTGLAVVGTESFTYGIDAGFVFDPAAQRGIAVLAGTGLMGLNSGDDDCLLSIDVTTIKKIKEAK